MEQLDEFMAGESILAGFSSGTMVVMLGVLALSASCGFLFQEDSVPEVDESYFKDR